MRCACFDEIGSIRSIDAASHLKSPGIRFQRQQRLAAVGLVIFGAFRIQKDDMSPFSPSLLYSSA